MRLRQLALPPNQKATMKHLPQSQLFQLAIYELCLLLCADTSRHSYAGTGGAEAGAQQTTLRNIAH
jgi:hypothetical protein